MFTEFDVEAIATDEVPQEVAKRMRAQGNDIYLGIQRRHALLKRIAPQVGMSEKDPRFIRQYIEPFYKKTADLLNRIP